MKTEEEIEADLKQFYPEMYVAAAKSCGMLEKRK